MSKKHGKLITFLRTFMKSRPTKQKLKQRGILKERVFGCDLGEHLLNSGFEGKSKLFELMVLDPHTFVFVFFHQSPATRGKWCVLWFRSAADAQLQSLTSVLGGARSQGVPCLQCCGHVGGADMCVGHGYSSMLHCPVNFFSQLSCSCLKNSHFQFLRGRVTGETVKY